MERFALITVEKTFCIRSDVYPQRSVLVVDPRLPVPPDGWKERTETVSVLPPEGPELEAPAKFSLSHLNIRTTEREFVKYEPWRVTILFEGLTSDDVPNGSRIFVSQEIKDALFPKSVA